MRFSGRFIESANGGGRWRVRLIEEGTSKRGFPVYPAHALREAANGGLFELRPCLLYPKLSSTGQPVGEDHQSRMAAVGRGAMNQVGHYEATRWVESANGQPGYVAGTLVLALGDPAADELEAKLTRLAESGGLSSLGLSIDADGDLTPSGAVSRIYEISSVDVVTNPGMGGKFSHRIAASTSGARTMDLLKILRERYARLIEGYNGPELEASVVTHVARRLRESEEARECAIELHPSEERDGVRARLTEDVADVLSLLDEAQMLISIVREQMQQAAGAAIAAASEAPPSAPAPAPTPTPSAAEEDAAANLTESETTRRLRVLESRESMRAFEHQARRANLPRASIARIRGAHEGQILEPAQITRLVESEAATVDSILRERGGRVAVVREGRNRLVETLAHLFAPNRCPLPADSTFERHGFSLHRFTESAWGVDLRRLQEGQSTRRRLRESVDQTNFDQVYADALNLAVNATYQGDPQMGDQAWRQIAAIAPASDFRTHKDITLGNYGTLPSVAKRSPYTSLTTPTDRQETWALGKYGGTEDIAWEDMVDDNLGVWQEMVRRLGMAARETLNDAVFSLIRFATMPTMSDTNALCDSGRSPANAGTSVLSNDATGWANLMAAATAMMGHTGGGGKPKGIKPSTLVIPKEKAHIAGGLLSDFGANAGSTDFPGRQGLTILGVVLRNVVIDLYTSNATDWFVMADPADAPVLKVAFLNGREEPELFFDDNANVSTMFTQDIIRAKIRHVWSAWASDWVGIHGNDAAS